MLANVLQALNHPITALVFAFMFAAIAVGGKFSLRVAFLILFLAEIVGASGIWGSGAYLTPKVLDSVGLTIVLVGIGWWVNRPKDTIKIKVADIHVANLPERPGEMLLVQAFFKNVTDSTIKMRNVVFAQTTQIPATLQEEKKMETDLWKSVSDGVNDQGRDAEIPATSSGEMNQIFESNPFGVEELISFAKGTHAVYFGAIMQDRKTRKNLIEMLFFVRRDGTISYCSQHNKP
jgi:hypothetical protein